MSNTIFVVKWHSAHALPFLGPSTARYVALSATPDEPCALEDDPRLATVLASRETARRLRDLAQHDLSTWQCGVDAPVMACNPGQLVVVPTTRKDWDALCRWYASMDGGRPFEPDCRVRGKQAMREQPSA